MHKHVYCPQEKFNKVYWLGGAGGYVVFTGRNEPCPEGK